MSDKPPEDQLEQLREHLAQDHGMNLQSLELLALLHRDIHASRFITLEQLPPIEHEHNH